MNRRPPLGVLKNNPNGVAQMAQASGRKPMTRAEKTQERSNIDPQRFALIFDPPSVVLEYRDKKRDSLRHRKMQIPESCLHDVDLAVKKLVRHNNIHLHPSIVSKEQVKRLVERLIAGSSAAPGFKVEQKDVLSRAAAADPFTAGGGDPFAQPEVALDKVEVMTGKLDLQTADDEVVKKAKEIMEEDFDKHALRPGDANFVYDKRIEFTPVEGAGDWDDDSSEDGIEDEPSLGPVVGTDDKEEDDMYNF